MFDAHVFAIYVYIYMRLFGFSHLVCSMLRRSCAACQSREARRQKCCVQFTNACVHIYTYITNICIFI